MPAQRELPEQQGTALLWALECAAAEGCDLTCFTREERTLFHSFEQGRVSIPMLRVGRLVQDEFFQVLMPNPGLHEGVSREHFQIWAQQMPSPDGFHGARIPCKIILSNCSANGTMVNGEYLRAPGEQRQIRHGDIIGLPRAIQTSDGTSVVPFISFVFTLAGSILCDTDFALEVVGAETSLPSCARVAVESPERCLPSESFLASDEEMTPAFFLEVGGAGVQDGVEPENARITHILQGGFSDLFVGRSEQPDFWKTLLRKKAYEMLSRKHLKFVVSGHPSSGDATVQVENLAEQKEVYICNAFESMSVQDAVVLRTREKRQLRRGDILLVNPCKEWSVWLMFFDFARTRSATPSTEELTCVAAEICASRAAAHTAFGGA